MSKRKAERQARPWLVASRLELRWHAATVYSRQGIVDATLRVVGAVSESVAKTTRRSRQSSRRLRSSADRVTRPCSETPIATMTTQNRTRAIRAQQAIGPRTEHPQQPAKRRGTHHELDGVGGDEKGRAITASVRANNRPKRCRDNRRRVAEYQWTFMKRYTQME